MFGCSSSVTSTWTQYCWPIDQLVILCPILKGKCSDGPPAVLWLLLVYERASMGDNHGVDPGMYWDVLWIRSGGLRALHTLSYNVKSKSRNGLERTHFLGITKL